MNDLDNPLSIAKKVIGLQKKLIKELENEVERLIGELVEARKYDNCICKGQRRCSFHALLEEK